MTRILIAAFIAAIIIAYIVSAKAQSLGALAQQCANSLAARNHLDHRGFFEHRGPAGARAENVLVGCKDQACAIRGWMRSPGHRRNIMQFGHGAIAWADTANGKKRFWCQEF